MKILWIPHTGWHIPQRAHLFCRPLAEKYEVHVTDWAADFSSPRDYFSRRYLRNFTYHRYMDGKITVHGIPRISPALYVDALRHINTRIFSHYVQGIIDRNKIDVVVGTFVVPPPRARRLIFDLFDDNVALWKSLGRVPGIALEIEQVEQQYLKLADAVVAASSVLAKKAQAASSSGSVFHIPNGIDLNLYQNVDGKFIRDQSGIKGKMVGVIGNHDRLAELKKILALAKIFSNQNITFLVVGRGSAIQSAIKMAKDDRLSNIRFTGYVQPNEMPTYAAAIDVGLCPYEKTPGDEVRSPMRLLTYSAAGTPVVSTDLEEVRRMNFSNVVLVSDNIEAMAEGIRAAFQLPRGRPPQIANYDIHCLVNQFQNIIEGPSGRQF